MRQSFSILRWVALLFTFAAIILTGFQLVRYSRVRSFYPEGLTVASIPVGDLDRENAAKRILNAYSYTLIELHYGTSAIQVRPNQIGFELKLEEMLSAADLQRINQPFWTGFWDYLWNRHQPVSPVPLSYTMNETRAKNYLQEIALRYDQPPSAPQPIPGTMNFNPGQPGSTLDVNVAVPLLVEAMRSPSQRVVELPLKGSIPPRPSYQNLKIMLQQIIDVSDFKGIVELYLEDLQTYQVLHFTYQSGQEAPAPDIAFSSWSTIKIPVMVSAFRRMDEPSDPEKLRLMGLMIDRSDNDSTDKLAQLAIDKNLAPIWVTEDMQYLGLVNTLWAGYFYPGAPLLQRYETPANTRTDIDTGPDIYDQTTASDMGLLLEDIYQCAEYGGGSLVAAYPGEISQNECKQMVSFLLENKIAVLIQAGVPTGTRVAHKHGWANETDGVIHTMGDVAIVYTPNADYVLTIFVHDPVQVLYDPVNLMIAQLSGAIYNFYNSTVQ